jgi:hypothetical protein
MQKNEKVSSMIIASFGKAHASMALLSLFAIIQGCIKNSILHLQNPRKWNDLRAQLSTFPFTKGFAALLMLLFLRPWRFYLAVWEIKADDYI